MTAPTPPRPEAMSPAERLRARMEGQAPGPPIALAFRPEWLKLLNHYEDIGPDSTESRTHDFAEALLALDRRGHPVPGELRILARAFLQPKHYQADRDRARTHDPATSQQAANDEARPRRSRSHAHRLLGAYARVADLDAQLTDPSRSAPGHRQPYYGGLTAPEAALIIGKPGAWRRTPELHRDGLIEPIPWSEYAGDKQPGADQFPEMAATRETVHGQQARVFRITDRGRDELRRMDRDERERKRDDAHKAARKAARSNKA